MKALLQLRERPAARIYGATGRRDRIKGRGGFSLMELLVVMNIGMWMAWASITALWGVSSGIAMNSRVSDLQAILEVARSRAMQLNTYVYVGFFESDGANAGNAFPVRSGVGKVWVGAVATKDGSPGYNPADPSSSLDSSNLIPIGKLRMLENLHLNQSLPFTSTRMITNSVILGSSVPAASSFGWPVNTKAMVTGFSSAVLQFSPRGTVTIPGSMALPESIQIALMPSKGGMVPSSAKDTAVVQVDSINGIVKTFRPNLP
jgi:hypothetical protein